MPYQIKPIEAKQQWEEFIDNLAPHTFLQSWQWGALQGGLGNKIYRLGIFENNILCGVAFIYKITAKRGSFLFCPHGPLIDWKKQGLLILLLNYLKDLGQKERVDFIRISPLVENSYQTKNVFKQMGFRDAPIHMMHPELAMILNIALPETELLAKMEKRTRYSINKAKRDGVKIRQFSNAKDIDIFYNLYQKTAARQKFTAFSLTYIQKEFEAFVNEKKVALFFAYYKDNIIAGALIVFANGSGFYHQGASIREYKNVPAAELLQWEAILETKRRDMQWYNFWGIAPENVKNHPWAGLTRFKAGFGGFSQEYLHCQDFILTPKYWLNYFVEKMRKTKRGY